MHQNSYISAQVEKGYDSLTHVTNNLCANTAKPQWADNRTQHELCRRVLHEELDHMRINSI